MADLPEPQLDAAEYAAFEKGVEQFNEGLYFECHDTLEELWSGIRGPSRDFFQGLIQVSVGYYHLANDNLAGAVSMFERACARLERYPERYFGFDVGRQRSALLALASRLRDAGRVPPELTEHRPRWEFDHAAGEGI